MPKKTAKKVQHEIKNMYLDSNSTLLSSSEANHLVKIYNFHYKLCELGVENLSSSSMISDIRKELNYSAQTHFLRSTIVEPYCTKDENFQTKKKHIPSSSSSSSARTGAILETRI